MTGDRTFTIGLDFSSTYYNGTTTFGRITWSDSVAGVLATEDLTADLSFQSIALVLDATLTTSKPAGSFSGLSLTQLAATASNSTTLSGAVSDAQNNPLTLQWSVVSSPVGSSVIFANDAAIATGATFSAVGDYTLRLTATDNWGASDSQDFVVMVVESVPATSNHAVPHAWLDGINAAWSSDYEAAALTDHDGDGIPTWQEYWTGTNPLDRSSVFKIDSITIDGTEVVLEWRHAEVGASIPDILIQASPDLNSDTWVTVGSYSPVDGINSVRMATPPTRRFYRLAMPSTP